MPIYNLPDKFRLRNGKFLRNAFLEYTVLGNLETAHEIIWICHPLTANSRVDQWWSALFQEHGGWIDTGRQAVICANIPGSCYGSISAEEIVSRLKKDSADSEEVAFDNQDVISCFESLRIHLGIEKIDYLVGGSLGGQQALLWSTLNPALLRNLILIACNAVHSPWGIAFNHLQRQAISFAKTSVEGLSLARQIAMLSYRSYDDFQQQQSGKTEVGEARASSYLTYQGEKFQNRFDTSSYILLSQMMDSHNLSAVHGESLAVCLGKITADTLIIGIDSDILFPADEQRFLAAHITGSEFKLMSSAKGHDAFLAEASKVSEIITKHYKLANYEYT